MVLDLLLCCGSLDVNSGGMFVDHVIFSSYEQLLIYTGRLSTIENEH